MPDVDTGILKFVDEGDIAAAWKALDMPSAEVHSESKFGKTPSGTRLVHCTTRRLSLCVAGKTYVSQVQSIQHVRDGKGGSFANA